MEELFSRWFSWKQRDEFAGRKAPGIYVLSLTPESIAGQKFTFRKEIVYVGMTNAIAGLRGRLLQFDQTISKKRSLHGGGDRFPHKHQDYDMLVSTLHVALRHFDCDPKRQSADDLRIMGDVASCEYECMARYVELHGRLPEFNCKRESHKFRWPRHSSRA